MTRIALVVSDVDGTLLTKDKVLTERAAKAARELRDAGIAFTITSSRPAIGMGFLIAPLQIDLPVGPFNGSSIIAPDMRPLEQSLIPARAAESSIDLLHRRGVDIWVFTADAWLTRNPLGDYVPNEQRAIRADPTIIGDFAPYLSSACKIVGASRDFDLLARCEAEMRELLGTEATAVRSQSYYLDITPPGRNKGTFVTAMAQRLGIPLDQVATIGDMHNDVAMFEVSGLSIAMGNASDEVKSKARRVTTSNQDEGFANAMEMILAENAQG
ncbi:Cof-type HAD-IIB family hydrolase [Bradyrhizobium sp. STM 3809]|uniref:Cof-type HAD-IIB family hydrolase n=1 Tax=Bradyrhizobium sp. STM 3809 TaxID=551936 RepID=UPI00024065E9|nr:Cof-type HAD-IIB family hydrolase [Bradyrhizobium sp. STM 3809]CCD99613.1 putative Cof hydrolase [Bradyrhizobium sp. STM 3809]